MALCVAFLKEGSVVKVKLSVEKPDFKKILKALGDIEKYFTEGEVVMKFLNYVREDRKFKCVDLSHIVLDRASITELFDHMQLIRLFCHGLCEDLGPILKIATQAPHEGV
mmetsp:Transcript_33214/g.56468  ORF Transcript_33214/g.56468 Transcript_33214/m.56468 type:complete len:110 (-) Transcript_33214:497-826(-)